MNKALEYMLKNPAKVKAQAIKIAKNTELAEDLVQDLIEYFLGCPEREIKHPIAYVWLGLYSRFKNEKRLYLNKLVFDKHSEETGMSMSYFDTLEAKDEFEEADSRLGVETMLGVMREICSPKEIEAILTVLELDDISVNVVGETVRSQRRQGILRIQKSLFNKKLGIPRSVNSDRSFYLRDLERRKDVKNSTNS